MKGRSPRLSAKPSAYGDSEKFIEAYELQAFVPRFAPAEDGIQVLDPADYLPSVKEVSFTDPEVVSLYFESFTGAEPAIGYDAFVKGVISASYIVHPDQRMALKVAIEELSRAVMAGAPIPSVNEEFEERVRHIIDAIFANNEPLSWRNLLAFTAGAFWALAFIKEPFQKVKNEMAPVTWVQALAEHFAQLGYLPQ